MNIFQIQITNILILLYKLKHELKMYSTSIFQVLYQMEFHVKGTFNDCIYLMYLSYGKASLNLYILAKLLIPYYIPPF